MKSFRAGGLMLVTLIALLWAPAAFAQKTTTEPTPKDPTTTTEPTKSETTDVAATPDPWSETTRTRFLRRRAAWLHFVARRLSNLTQHRRPHVHRTRADFDSLVRYRLWFRDAWRLRAVRARYRAHHPPHLSEWLCIHRGEGSWRDPDSPYFGGLQMDISFQRTYGPGLLRREGTADHWARYEQMWIAERALRAGRGFYPWPLTARSCGLI